MSALERINNAYLELLSAAVLGDVSGKRIAADLRENSELWSKVYVSEETSQMWMELIHQEEFECEALYLLAPSDGILQLMALANEWGPTLMTTRKTAYEIPYHSLILHFTHE
jgi:hypothetical protein